MSRSLVGLAFRVGTRCAGLAVHGAAGVADRALGLVSSALGGPAAPEVDLDGSPHDGASARRTDPGRRATRAPAAPAPTRAPAPNAQTPAPAPNAQTPAPAAPAPTPAPAPNPQTPTANLDPPSHVSQDATLVDSIAEAGAEDGAGAQVTVAEPWTGYRKMKADDVIDRLATATSAQLAAVGLYERSTRGRQSIVDAVERELKRASG